MTTWILIFAIYLNADKSGVSITTAEFNSKEYCEIAGKAMKTEWNRGSLNFISDQSRFVCVKK